MWGLFNDCFMILELTYYLEYFAYALLLEIATIETNQNDNYSITTPPANEYSVWAIGTGKVATPETAENVHKQIRSILAGMYDQETADATRILYGGSVTPESVDELMAQPDIDGALVGGASLDAEKFARIINFKA